MFIYILISLYILIINLNPKPNYLIIIDSLTVDDLKGLLKKVLKGKSKEINRDDLLIDWSNVPTHPTRRSTYSGYGVAGPSSSKSKGSKKSVSVQSSPTRSSKSNSISRSESNSSSRSSSHSPPHSPPAGSGSIYICYEDMSKELRNALRVRIFLPICQLYTNRFVFL